ncbi:MAG TPA: hypothetical protein VM846_15615 [Vicinamibacterales bacterium]|nr:hypothetical protein [Vicinamibacterales bacterium]
MRGLLSAVLLLFAASAASAQQRPLITEDPETIGAGRVLAEAGVDYARDAEYPASGLEGQLFRFPVLGFSFGVSSIAEIQIDGGPYNRLSISSRTDAPLSSMVTATGDSTVSVEDIVFATKVRIVPEGVTRPAIGFRFATRLPNASNESGLGLDTTDFLATLLFGKTVRSIRVVGNGGLGILGDPTRGDRQNDVLLYGVSLARAVTDAAELVGEIVGRLDVREGDPPPGTESRSILQIGARYTIGGWRGDASVFFGLTPNTPAVGVGAGFTYVFNAFSVP